MSFNHMEAQVDFASITMGVLGIELKVLECFIFIHLKKFY